MVTVQLQPVHPEMGRGIPLPARMSQHAAGMDLAAALDEPLTLEPGRHALVPCGFAMALPPGYEAQVRPRSGLASKHGVTVLNSPGTIDADYRGEVKVLLINLSQEAFEIRPGERIAQMVVAPVVSAAVEVVSHLPPSERAAGGFGSTGR